MNAVLRTIGRLPVPNGLAVPLTMVAGWMLLGAWSPAAAAESMTFTAIALVQISPFFALSVLMAAYAKASDADGLIARAFSGHPTMMVLAGALIGALSPFCSCGVVPIIAALLAMGVPLPAVMAFWIASPIMDPSMFVLTVGALGLHFAVAKTAIAVLIGLYAGYATQLLLRVGAFDQPLRPEIGNGGCGVAKTRRRDPVVWRFWGDRRRRAIFTDSAVSTTLFLGKWLTLAFMLESLMVQYIPADAVANWLGGDGWLTILGATLVGVPAYLNGYAALPLVGGLIDQGMAPGAGMTFLIAGGVTSIPAAIAVWVIARPPVFLAYVAYALTGAFGFGLLYGAIA